MQSREQKNEGALMGVRVQLFLLEHSTKYVHTVNFLSRMFMPVAMYHLLYMSPNLQALSTLS